MTNSCKLSIFIFRCEIDPFSFVMQVRAQKFIKQGEEITTRYLGPWEGQPNRQLKIQGNWKFICNCLRCQDPSDLATYFSAIKCNSCFHDLSNESSQTSDFNQKDEATTICRYLLPVDSQTLGVPWKCQNCGTMKTVTEINKILETIERMVESKKSEILCCIRIISPDIVKIIETSVNKMEQILHQNHFLVFKFKKWVLRLPLSAQATSSDKIDFLELQLKYHSDVMEIIEVLDPGLTLNRASHHKEIAQCRIQLSKQKVMEKT